MTKRATLCMVGVLSLVTLTGCFSMPWDRTGDQGGSNVLQATTKLLSNDLGSLNPDDVQVLADLGTAILKLDVPEVTNEQAAAVVAFLQANGIQTIQDLQQLIEDAQQDIDSVVIPEEVYQVLIAMVANVDEQGVR